MKTLLAIFAFVLAASSFTSEVHANELTVRIDNYLNPSAYTHAKSNDTITVSVRYCSNCSWTEQTRVMSWVSGSHDFVFEPNGLDAYDVYQVRVEAGGNDLFIVDQIELFDSVDYRIKYWGSDNEYGWCFSYQASDGNNSKCYQDIAHWSESFATGF